MVNTSVNRAPPVSEALCWGLGRQERARPPNLHPQGAPLMGESEVYRQCHYRMTKGVGLTATPGPVLVAPVAAPGA